MLTACILHEIINNLNLDITYTPVNIYVCVLIWLRPARENVCFACVLFDSNVSTPGLPTVSKMS